MSQEATEAVDLQNLVAKATSSGPQWGGESEDLNMTLLVWREGEGIAAHVNQEVDVLIVAIAGRGRVTIDGRPHELRAGQAVLIPKSTERSVVASEEGLSHLNVHKRRGRLMPGTGSDAWRNRVHPAEAPGASLPSRTRSCGRETHDLQ